VVLQSSYQKKCILQLDGKFPKSVRVERLKALQLEANGEFDKALAVYSKLITADTTDAVCHFSGQGENRRRVEGIVHFVQR
jgi:hypothetical protein